VLWLAGSGAVSMDVGVNDMFRKRMGLAGGLFEGD